MTYSLLDPETAYVVATFATEDQARAYAPTVTDTGDVLALVEWREPGNDRLVAMLSDSESAL